MKYTAFYKGFVVDDAIMLRIMDAAKRGFITEAGKELQLVPDTRFGKTSESGLREFGNGQITNKGNSREKKHPRLRKSQLVPLTAMLAFKK